MTLHATTQSHAQRPRQELPGDIHLPPRTGSAPTFLREVGKPSTPCAQRRPGGARRVLPTHAAHRVTSRSGPLSTSRVRDRTESQAQGSPAGPVPRRPSGRTQDSSVLLPGTARLATLKRPAAREGSLGRRAC